MTADYPASRVWVRGKVEIHNGDCVPFFLHRLGETHRTGSGRTPSSRLPPPPKRPALHPAHPAHGEASHGHPAVICKEPAHLAGLDLGTIWRHFGEFEEVLGLAGSGWQASGEFGVAACGRSVGERRTRVVRKTVVQLFDAT